MVNHCFHALCCANGFRSMLLNSLNDHSLSTRHRLAMLLPPLQGLLRYWLDDPGRRSFHLASPGMNLKKMPGGGTGPTRCWAIIFRACQPFQFEPTHLGCYGDSSSFQSCFRKVCHGRISMPSSVLRARGTRLTRMHRFDSTELGFSRPRCANSLTKPMSRLKPPL